METPEQEAKRLKRNTSSKDWKKAHPTKVRAWNKAWHVEVHEKDKKRADAMRASVRGNKGNDKIVGQRRRKAVRRSISLGSELDARIRNLAQRQNRTANQVIENLIETGVEAKEAEKRRFFELAERLRVSTDPAEIKQLKEQLAYMTFGV